MKTKDSEGVKHGVSIGNATGGAGNASAADKPAKSPGQKVSQERGVATHNKKNPGKRPSQGGN